MTESDLYNAPGTALKAAIKVSVGGSGGPSDYFSTVLALLMMRDFAVRPGKKKAILIWELFFRNNYVWPPSAAPCVMLTQEEDNALSILEKNVESDGGVPSADIESIRGRVNAISASYQSAAGLGKWARFSSSGGRKIATVDAGFAGLFSPIQKNLAQPLRLEAIGTNVSGVGSGSAQSVRKCLPTLVRVAEKAEFTLYNVGLGIFGYH